MWRQIEIFIKFSPVFLYFSCFLCVDNELYIGTEADFSGNDPIIYREPLQTDQYDSLSLNGKFLSVFYIIWTADG